MRRVSTACFIVNRQARGLVRRAQRAPGSPRGARGGRARATHSKRGPGASRERSWCAAPSFECDLVARTRAAREGPRRAKKAFPSERLRENAARRAAPREPACGSRNARCDAWPRSYDIYARWRRDDATERDMSRRRASNHWSRSSRGNASHRGLVLATVRHDGSRCEVLAQIVRSYR